jgi:hypothetical protein
MACCNSLQRTGRIESVGSWPISLLGANITSSRRQHSAHASRIGLKHSFWD